MSKPVQFRVSDQHFRLLDYAERMMQKPRGQIVAELLEKHLAPELIAMFNSGIKPRPFSGPPQRSRKQKEWERRREQNNHGGAGPEPDEAPQPSGQ